MMPASIKAQDTQWGSFGVLREEERKPTLNTSTCFSNPVSPNFTFINVVSSKKKKFYLRLPFSKKKDIIIYLQKIFKPNGISRVLKIPYNTYCCP